MKKPVIAVIDYGMGNLRSVSKALEKAGASAVVTSSKNAAASADAIVLPGVGSFGPAMKNLENSGFDKTITRAVGAGKPFLGLCLGFQMLFDKSFEDGVHKGLGILPGKVLRFGTSLKVPHMGWNNVSPEKTQSAARMFDGIPKDSYFYFVHSYYAVPSGSSAAAGTTRYAVNFCSAAARDRIWGCQFHPEKSGSLGLKLLRNFVREVNRC